MTRLSVLAIAIASTLSAQPRRLSGTVVDQKGSPVEGAQVEAVGTFALVATGRDGAFVLATRVPFSRLAVRRLGFVPAYVDVGQSADSLRVTMQAIPLRLSGVVVPATAPSLSQTITAQSVANLPALGEPDILRVLPFLGAVSQPNDMMSQTHLAGASADETSVTLDGHPMLSPTHLYGMFSGLSVAVIDKVDVFVHQLPATRSARVGGLLAVSSFAPDTSRREVTVSLLSSSAMVSQPRFWKRISALASARATYLDRLLNALRPAGSGDQPNAPSYWDGLLRLDIPVGDALSIEPILFVTQDAHRPPRSASPEARSTTLHEYLTGITAKGSFAGWNGQVRLSQDAQRTRNPARLTDGSERFDLTQQARSAGVTAVRPVRGLLLSAALSWDHRDVRYDWRNMHSRSELSPWLPSSLRLSQQQTLVSASSEVHANLTPALTLTTGGRWMTVASRSHVAPQARLRWSAGRMLTVVFGADRRFQFDGEYGGRDELNVVQPMFLFDRPRISDGAGATMSLGGEQYGSRFVTVDVTAFARRVSDRPIGVDTRFGSDDSLKFDPTRGRSAGIATTLTVIDNARLSVQAAYTFQRTWQRADSIWIPSSWDLPHTLAAFAGVPLPRGWAFTFAAQLHSGIPATPVEKQVLVPTLRNPTGLTPRLFYGATNSARLPGFQRVDVGVRRSWKKAGLDWTVNFQVVNALARENPFAYNWRLYMDALATGREPPPSRTGLPILPSLGVSVRW